MKITTERKFILELSEVELQTISLYLRVAPTMTVEKFAKDYGFTILMRPHVDDFIADIKVRLEEKRNDQDVQGAPTPTVR